MKQKQQDDAKIALDKESPKKHENFSAKVELARNIQTEQKKLKDKSLEELKNMIIPTDKNKLNEISKKLGIELGGLETKKTIERIVGNEKELQELTNKFTEKSE